MAEQRLRRQRLAGSGFADPVEAVGWFGAVQSQLFAASAWGIGQRCADVDDAGFRAAFDSGAIVRTHVLRPTWHLVAPADLQWMQALTAPQVHRSSAFYYRKAGLDDALFHRCAEVISAALQGGQYLTRTELAAVLERSGIAAEGNRLAYIVMWCELEAMICSGPMRGRQHTYALVDERVAGSSPIHDREGALAELARRYFTSHGPAQIRDFAWWSGLRVTEARQAVKLAAAELEERRVDGEAYFDDAAQSTVEDPAPSTRADGGASVCLLPNYDEFVVAYQDRSALFSSAAGAPALGGMDALTNNLVVERGQVVGTWKPEPRSGEVRVIVTTTHPGAVAALERATHRYGQFLGIAAELELVTPHTQSS